MFHPEIGYAEALRSGNVQEEILHEHDAGREPDLARAERLIFERLPPIQPACRATAVVQRLGWPSVDSAPCLHRSPATPPRGPQS